MKIKTADDVKSKIEWLQDDIMCCRNAMRNTYNIAERNEYMYRISADQAEITRLKGEI